MKEMQSGNQQCVIRQCLSRPWQVLVHPYLLFTQVVATATAFIPERRPVTRVPGNGSMRRLKRLLLVLHLLHPCSRAPAYGIPVSNAG